MKVNTWSRQTVDGGVLLFTALHNYPRFGLDSCEFGVPLWLRQSADAANFQGGLLFDRCMFRGPALGVGGASTKQEYRQYHQHRPKSQFSRFTGQVQFQSVRT